MPETISGKIRRLELRGGENEVHAAGERLREGYGEEDFPSRKGVSGTGGARVWNSCSHLVRGTGSVLRWQVACTD